MTGFTRDGERGGVEEWSAALVGALPAHLVPPEHALRERGGVPPDGTEM